MSVALLIALLTAADLESKEPQVETAGLSHLMRGLHFLSGGQASAAVPHLRLALLYDPGSPFIHAKLSEAWLRAGERDKAEAIVEAGLEQAPTDPVLNLRAGTFAAAAERFSAAIEPLTIAGRADATRDVAVPLLVDALLWGGKGPRAWAAARRAAREDPSNVGMLHAMGAAFEDHRDLPHALEMYGRARSQKPSNRTVALSEMRARDLAGQPLAAAQALIELFTFYPNEPQLFMLVYRYERAADREDASAYLREAQRLAGRDHLAALGVARGLAVEGQLDEAISYLEGLELERDEIAIYLAELEHLRGRTADCARRLRSVDDERALRRLARCESELGHLRRAMAVVGQMLESGARLDIVAGEAALVSTWASSLEEARNLFRRFLEQAGGRIAPRERELAEAQISDHFGETEDVLARLTQLDREYPRDVEIDLRLADAHSRFGEQDRGLAIFESLVAESPTNAARLNALGFTLADANRDLDRAEVLLRRAYRLSFDEGYITDSLGWLHYRRGELATALKLIERAIRLDGPEAVLLLHQGDVLRALGREQEARTAYRDAQRYNPSVETRGLLEERLKRRGPRRVRSTERGT